MTSKTVGIVGLGIAAVGLLYARSASAATRAKTQGPKPVSGPGGSNWLQKIPDLLSNFLPKPSSGGLSFGSGGGSGTGATRPLAQTDAAPMMPRSGTQGTYVIHGQPYNRDGQALDENGRVVPNQWDNTGLGPAGAGLNADGTLASDPLEYANDVPVFLNNPAADLLPGEMTPQNNDLLNAAHDELDLLPSSDLAYAWSGDDGFGAPEPVALNDDGSFLPASDSSHSPDWFMESAPEPIQAPDDSEPIYLPSSQYDGWDDGTAWGDAWDSAYGN